MIYSVLILIFVILVLLVIPLVTLPRGEFVAKTEFEQLNANGMNYMSWTINMQSKLESMGISDAIKENNICSKEEKAKALIILRKHINDMLKYEYYHTKDPSVLWKDLKIRFDNQKGVSLPYDMEELKSVRFQEFVMYYELNVILLIVEKNDELNKASIAENNDKEMNLIDDLEITNV